ncbi:MAG TPA: hypothetical protein VKV39_01585 [Candidatus Sulfotelmatobacter sp.]|nr:hypothetical protein [Candidatus Sulfotelmatobacter sp.]
MAASKLSILGFGIILTLAAFRAYQYPAYSSDGFQYMANAVAMHGAHAPEIHSTVYHEVYAGVPANILDHLLGKDELETSQSLSFRTRAVDPYRFTEFLPCFAVRPIFNEMVYVLHYGLGMSLLRATVIIPVVSYWLMGWLALIWISRYVATTVAALITSLLMLTPPVWDLARWTTPDAFSAMALLAALFVIFEKNWISTGLTILLAAVYIRTDNFLLALLVLAYLSIWEKRIDVAKAAVLAAVACGSVFLINHFAGDYGRAMLYYRAFVAIPQAPGEYVAHFGWHDYFAALRRGTASVVHESFIPFALMGLVGWIRRPTSGIVALITVSATYTATHFVLYPEPEERFCGVFFVGMGIALASALATSARPAIFAADQAPHSVSAE